jgi:riboflavin synthase
VFTGLIEDLGEITGVEHSGDGVRLTVRTGLAGEIAEGDSVAVNGVCLTATTVDRRAGTFATDVMNETLQRSSLDEIPAAGQGHPVNLELAMRAGDRFGGHVVQGHVDGTGTIAAITPDGFARRVEIAMADDGALLRYVVPKGSITVDGISLTVASLGERSFTVSLIPETLERTNLGAAAVGATVNLEVDVLAKYVERLVNR